MATAFDPFWLFKMPLSGDVMQRINSPTFNFAGDAKIEDRVVSEVASYGKQIGWLNDLVLQLAQKQEPDPKVLAKLTAAVAEIDEIKQAQSSTVLQAAGNALDQLKASAPLLYQALIQRHAAAAAAVAAEAAAAAEAAVAAASAAAAASASAPAGSLMVAAD